VPGLHQVGGDVVAHATQADKSDLHVMSFALSKRGRFRIGAAMSSGSNHLPVVVAEHCSRRGDDAI
jgi:hypothetical protein